MRFLRLLVQTELEFPALQANHSTTALLKQQLKPYSAVRKLGYILLLGFTFFPGRRYHVPLPSSALETFQLAQRQENCPTPSLGLSSLQEHVPSAKAFHRPPRLPPALTEVTEASSIP